MEDRRYGLQDRSLICMGNFIVFLFLFLFSPPHEGMDGLP